MTYLAVSVQRIGGPGYLRGYEPPCPEPARRPRRPATGERRCMPHERADCGGHDSYVIAYTTE